MDVHMYMRAYETYMINHSILVNRHVHRPCTHGLLEPTGIGHGPRATIGTFFLTPLSAYFFERFLVRWRAVILALRKVLSPDRPVCLLCRPLCV